MTAEIPLLLRQEGARIPAVKRYRDKFENHVVLVTGGAQGIGAVTAASFSYQGAHLVLVDMNEAKLKETAAKLTADGAKVMYQVCNLTDEAAVHKTIENVIAALGKIDVLVHLAGIYPFKLILDATSSDYQRTMSVNMDSTFHLVKAVLPHMNKAGYGRIITTTSGAALQPEAGLAVYAAAKSAVLLFTRAVAMEAGPGYDGESGLREMFSRAVARQAVKRYGLPTDVADMICFVASPEAEFLTGQNFDVGGGFTHGA
ncbi:(S)-1-Phenylethanol dehydrogenase [Cyphellophora attinorum]|uniref:(S)-1-Phenylethanol dehydrogenase n=1 Tax=Cyphellophora attinorum TaxID=1664694 RepID=A0A0N0NP98_9EURO|nr:(S)-1-Phenylethanol dehydrogenase [Phialophora attinorum]KPI42289.1 (S)-1-Phenylethanol dehydrogenase [Phialophora attinorum]